ncbi:MAG: hypothetical protein ACREJ2_12550 [Planctomycetota bacterium]
MRKQWQWLGMALVLVLAACARLSAEETTWQTAAAEGKELRLTFKSGDTVQGVYNAETDDKIMISVMTPKGPDSRTYPKADVVKHEWVEPLAKVMAAKLATFPVDKFEDMQTYAQSMINEGFLGTYEDFMRAHRSDLTVDHFKLYVIFLDNNGDDLEAQHLVEWAKINHADWRTTIDEVSLRLHKAPKLTEAATAPPKEGSKPETSSAPVLKKGEMYCAGTVPTAKEEPAFDADAMSHMKPAPVRMALQAVQTWEQTDPDVMMLTYECRYTLTSRPGGPSVNYSVGMIYIRHAHNVWTFNSMVVMPWRAFPHPADQ